MFRPTQGCAQTVAGWLSKSKTPIAAAPAAASSADPAQLFKPRPERLGLGAKFVPHSSVAALGADEQRFQKKLKAPPAKGAPAKGAPAKGASAKPADKKRHKEVVSSDDDEEERGRAASFAKKVRR